MKTLAEQLDQYRGVKKLDQAISRETLRGIRHLAFFLLSLTILILAAIQFTDLVSYTDIAAGVALLLLGLWLEVLLLSWYHNAFYFNGLNSILGSEGKRQSGCTYEVARMSFIDENDLTSAFIHSLIGQEIMARLGVTKERLAAFTGSQRPQISSRDMAVADGQITTLIIIAGILYQQDPAFRGMLNDLAVPPERFKKAVSLCVKTDHERKRSERWWSRDQLSKSQTLGGELAYGVAYELKRFSKSIYTSTIYSDLNIEASSHITPYSEHIEHTLARGKSANVLLIGNEGVGKMDIILGVAKRLRAGKGLHALHQSEFILLDTDRLFSVFPNRETFEPGFLDLMDQAALAGNCVVVIEGLSQFIQSAKQIGVSMSELLDIYLALPAFHIIATDTPGNYHTYLEKEGGLVRRFEEILVEQTNDQTSLVIIEQLALAEEKRQGVFFTYDAIESLVTVAHRYLSEGVMPDRAIQLTMDVISFAKGKKQTLINADLVYNYISLLTGIPAGPVSEGERDLLLNLEEVLGSKVIAQEKAVAAIARTMRRARAHIERSDKPIGSFLFFGPTGVGKTEAAKALAQIFFGSEETMVRLDMSEFSGPDALVRLIGDHDQPGILTSALREHPYTVLLLDEFEKSHPTAHDIFLQIIDEGYCTDGRGETVNARNTIIIATSNAGSDMIMRTTSSRQSAPLLDQEIIEYIIKQNIFKPELINRFDATILFEPLNETAKHQIAHIFLTELENRVRNEGYRLKIDRDVIPLLISSGFDERFGARPLARAIQDIIEDKLSKLIIDGTLVKGGEMMISKKDLVAP